MTIGQNIKLARKKAGLTQKQLAEKSGIATITLQQYERGVREPKLETIAKIARSLNLYASDLIIDQWKCVNMDPCDESEISVDDVLYQRMTMAFSKLNHKGAEKAADTVEDIAKIPEYRKE
ncbi:helix-turn-helix transcriptional regulator [Gemmiger formicilis]|uniref:helix-turn-helix domain-containing protein n=1 Tax=Gemmiger formicilis TaxID=745368 RepID=UPI00195928F5|nr:helix-turn-helix transcriptional regulator [Gemmiger formicilis]MBM6717927.1 helix-turn-helix transcriptional regulator [Gemmiger formicilis]